MHIGFLKWFSEEKGYGVIISLGSTPDLNQDVFLHISNWVDTIPVDFSYYVPLVFSINYERGKNTAKECRYLNNTKTDWDALFSFLGVNEVLEIEDRLFDEVFNIISCGFEILTEDFDEKQLTESLRNRLKRINIDELHLKAKTLLKIWKDTNLKKLKITLNEVITEFFQDIAHQHKIELWRNNYLPLSVFSKNDFLELFNVLTDDDVIKIQEEKITDELDELLKLWTDNLRSNFNIKAFITFKNIIKRIVDDSLKFKIIGDLNEIAKDCLLTSFYQELEKKGKVEGESELREIERLTDNILYFLSSELKIRINSIVQNYILNNSSLDGLIAAFIEGQITDPEVIKNRAKSSINELTISTFTQILNSEVLFDKHFIVELLFKLSSDSSKYEMIYEVAEKLNDESIFRKIDYHIFSLKKEDVYFKVWLQGKAKIKPLNYLLTYFDENQSKYNMIDDWINKKLISQQEVSSILFHRLENLKKITDRNEFYTVFNIIKKLIEFDLAWVDQIKSLKSSFFNLLLWHLGVANIFDFNMLKGKFIYFNPTDQVYIFKRLFYLKHIGKLNFSFEELDEILRADTDMFLINEKFTNDFVLDISTHILIEAIKSYKATGTFIFESDLILKDLKNNSKKKFKIEEYFAECPGRTIAKINWNTYGKIINKATTVYEGKEYRFFMVRFPYDKKLVDEIKKMPIRKFYNFGKLKFWAVSYKCEVELMEFGKNNGFLIDIEKEIVLKPDDVNGFVLYDQRDQEVISEFPFKKKIADNIHLIADNIHLLVLEKDKDKDEESKMIGFCEGRRAKKKHKVFNKTFWWCQNKACFQIAEDDHLSPKFLSQKTEADYVIVSGGENKKIWEYYTFLDILKILNINVDEYKKSPTDFIPNGEYYKFIGQINAFNRLVGKLYCEECNELLYPVESSHFALYRVTRFHCINEKCSEYHKPIYLSHCLNGECHNVVDSRVSKRCSNGMYICDSCGTCCSNELFKRRIDNLKTTGGYIHSSLIHRLNEKQGHLEKAEYYCYKCGGMMAEMSEFVYVCPRCEGVIYDFSKFKWIGKKWINKGDRRKDYPVFKKSKNNDDLFL